MFKMFVTLFLFLCISMLTQCAPAAAPAPAPCVQRPVEICETIIEFTGSLKEGTLEPVPRLKCRIEFKTEGDCGEGK